MPTWAKVLLGLLACGVLLVGAVIGGGMYWFNANKDRLVANGKVARAQGVELARTKSKPECVSYALDQLAQCGPSGSLMCEATNKVRMESCLENSAPDAAFCTDVPGPTEIMKMATWAVATCSKIGRPNDQACTRLYQGVGDFCHARPPR